MDVEIVPSDPFREYVLESYRYWKDCWDESPKEMTLEEFLDRHWQNKDWIGSNG